jgi:molecular chaperone HtpG
MRSVHAAPFEFPSPRFAARFAHWANLLFGQALLAAGGQLDNPASFVRWFGGLLAMQPSKSRVCKATR